MHDARGLGLTSPAVERALDRLHAAEYRARLGELFDGHTRLPARPAIVEGNAPGARLLERTPVAPSPLVDATP